MMAKPPTLTDRFRYAFDALIARGTGVVLIWHLLFSLTAVVLISLFIVVVGMVPTTETGETIPFHALVWLTLMHAIDPGTITGDEGTAPWRAIMMTATVLGIMLIGSLVAVLVATVAARFNALRQGHSRVLEQDHTLVLGWSPQLFTIIGELAVAREGKASCVVVFADQDKVWMESELKAKVRNPGRTRIVVRSGDPTDPDTLSLVALEEARSIVVLAPEGARNDTQVVRTLLSVGRTAPAEGRKQHVVTEIRDPGNIAVARLTGDRRIEVLEIGDLVAKIAVQTCLQAGLSIVYEELLGFEGNEIYFIESAEVRGKTFAKALHHFEDAALLGICDGSGRVELKPAMDRQIVAGDRLIVVAADDRWKSRPSTTPSDESLIVTTPIPARKSERTLILGWNSRVPAIVTGIDAYVSAGSRTHVVTLDPKGEPALAELKSRLKNTELGHQIGDVSDRKVLESLDPKSWDHVMVLPPDRIESALEADAQVLVALLHLRDIAETAHRPFSVVSEMRDVRSRDLAEVARADDFIISDRFLGLLLAQVTENPDLAAVFADLFDPEGAEIYLRSASDYVVLDGEVDGHVLIDAGVRRDEVVLGYWLARDAGDASKAFGIVINPAKSAKVKFGAADRVIVLAES